MKRLGGHVNQQLSKPSSLQVLKTLNEALGRIPTNDNYTNHITDNSIFKE